MESREYGQTAAPNPGSSPSPSGTELPELVVRVSKDRQEAYLSAKNVPLGQKIPENSVKQALAANGVVFGLLPEAIATFCASPTRETLCAHGTAPRDEETAKIEYLFRTDGTCAPKQREDGTVDFGSLGLVQNVKKGDVLCRIVPPKPGADGSDVTGKVLPHKKSRLPSLPSGHNVTASEDRMQLTASIDGCIEFHKGILNIDETFYVRGNVDGSSGNIVFTGTVIVQGDVLEGYAVVAGGDITVHGMVIGATLKAGGNITVSSGVNGMRGGTLTADGNITAHYFQSAQVRCGCDVYADTIMNSNIDAGGSVVMRGPNSSIMGGRCSAGHRIFVKTAGTPNNAQTELILNSPDLKSALAGSAARAGEIAALKEKTEAELRIQADITKQIKLLSGTLGLRGPSPKTQAMMDSLIQNQRKSENSVTEYSHRIEELENLPSVPLIEFNIAAIRLFYAGTKITIGSVNQYLSTDTSSMKFYIKDSQIVSGPTLPSDAKDF